MDVFESSLLLAVSNTCALEENVLGTGTSLVPAVTWHLSLFRERHDLYASQKAIFALLRLTYGSCLQGAKSCTSSSLHPAPVPVAELCLARFRYRVSLDYGL